MHTLGFTIQSNIYNKLRQPCAKKNKTPLTGTAINGWRR
ncbi:hypothetical protein PCARR_a3758 [Pseudoalteromonas carrageenovora IAM 12662]|uniref:Transposase n=1 Tax=Pseudoalteromonas carrageenovora IAM 12662 TaxID=1314868 RepID=A0ABR9EMH5_PSEVC|nr:hypothetical protein [Pseudoalteromonas carrageenovora IAM 12662]